MISEEFLNLARLDIRVSLFFLWRIRELYHIIFKQTNLLRVYVLLARQSTASVNNHYCVLVTYMRMRWWVKDNILTFFGCNLTINRCTGQLQSLAYSQTNYKGVHMTENYTLKSLNHSQSGKATANNARMVHQKKQLLGNAIGFTSWWFANNWRAECFEWLSLQNHTAADIKTGRMLTHWSSTVTLWSSRVLKKSSQRWLK